MSSINYFKEIQSGSANISTTPMNTFTNIIEIKTKIETIQFNADLLENLFKNENKTEQDLIKETINVNLILSKVNCSSTSNLNISDNCISTKIYAQEKILNILNKNFNCISIKDAIENKANINKFGYLLDQENFLNSVASLYISSRNHDSFSDYNINMINQINNCLLEYGPDLLEKINQNSKIENKSNTIKYDFLQMITTTSSNMIKIAMNHNQKECQKEGYNGTSNNDLILKNETINIKKTIEKNSLLFMKLNKELFTSDSTENLNKNNTKNSNNKIDQLKLITNNLVFYSKKSNIIFFNNTSLIQ
jgi:hypothetical protein